MLRKYAKKALRRLAATSYQPLNSIELSRNHLLHNVNLIVSQRPGFTVIPVLKGNAYGHGIEQVAEILNNADCSFLAVDGYFEAARIRDITRHQILVMGYILPKNVPLLDVRRCSFVVQDIAGLHAFGALGKPVRIHLELNTGMNRLGLQENELTPYLAVLKQYPQLTLEGVMSHLADADNELDDGYTVRQVQTFDALVERVIAYGFSPTYIHIAQTAGSVKAKSSHTNSIRLGIGTYGINPLLSGDMRASQLANLRPVLTLKSTVVKVLDLTKGDAVSYNGTFVAPKTMKIGVLPLGYYEGIPRALSNVGCVTYEGHILPIVGRVCMNHTMIDLQGADLGVGDVVTVISDDPLQLNSVTKLQSEHGLFSYGTLTGFSSSVRRTIV